MYEKIRIVQLHDQGYCTAAISVQLDLPSGYVRKVLAQVASRLAVAAVKTPRQRAEDKRAKALQLLAEADSVLE